MSRARFVSSLIAAAILSATGASALLAADLDSDYNRNHKQYRSNADADTYDEDDRGRYGYRNDYRRGDWDFARRHRIAASASHSGDYLPFFAKERRARWAAVEAWNRKVESRYGRRFANWRLATGKRIDCEGAAGSVYCTASGVPVRGWSRWGWFGAGRRYD